ncbi:hypothetical protein OEZ85_005738 [Tetradesmus obliquus]|uniref:Uncharacterized protein n=1 Tax=Tetradesmus obliquus TaxID=3088 RepID=A0ABY8UEW5_TETOB|nr:hypothetical protein OEZ85_005738 [Tetradesmus obliquus]
MLAGVMVGTAVAVLQWLGPAVPASHAADLNPYQEAKQMVYGPTADGSIRGCPSNVNPNCISTGSINDAYSPAWRSGEPSPSQAAEVLEDVVLSKLEGVRLLRSLSLQSGAEYRAFGVQSLFGEDVMEFVIKPESVQDRKWQGDAPGPLVTYRSMAGSVKYVWPIQQPLGDFDAQRKRLKLVRDELGWQIIGCELLECYQ